MGIDPTSVNVSDLQITRPDRSGPGGDIAGTPTVLGVALDACFIGEDRAFRRADGQEKISIGQFFVSPFCDDDGEIVAVEEGDLAAWTDHFGVSKGPKEIISVDPIPNASGAKLDIVAFRIG